METLAQEIIAESYGKSGNPAFVEVEIGALLTAHKTGTLEGPDHRLFEALVIAGQIHEDAAARTYRTNLQDPCPSRSIDCHALTTGHWQDRHRWPPLDNSDDTVQRVPISSLENSVAGERFKARVSISASSLTHRDPWSCAPRDVSRILTKDSFAPFVTAPSAARHVRLNRVAEGLMRRKI
jgi:hypothetical protein